MSEERRKTVKYTIIKKSNVRRDMMEKTFCFTCGFIQGDIKGKV